MSRCGRSLPSAAVVVAAAVLFAVGCTGSPPEILHVDVTLALRFDPSSASRYEALEVYVAVRDDDGDDDVALLQIVHDDRQLVWEFAREEWLTTTYGVDRWIGSSDLRMADDAPVPRGAYRALVWDVAQQQATADFFVTHRPVDLSDVVFPTFERRAGRVTVVSPAEALLRGYNRSGELIVNERVPPGPLADEIARRLDQAGMRVYLELDHETGATLQYGPVDWDATGRS